MQTYELVDPKTNEVLGDFDWSKDVPPTQEELQTILNSVRQGNPETPDIQQTDYGEGFGLTPSNKPSTTGEKISDFFEAARRGVGGAGIGMAQLYDKYLGGGENAKLYKQMEQIRRSEGDEQAAKYGERGFGNPISWGEAVGENLPSLVTMVGSGGLIPLGQKAAQYAPVMTKLSKYVQSAALGGGTGAVQGHMMPVVDEEERSINTLAGGGGGAVLAPVAKLGVEKAIPWLKESVPALAEKVVGKTPYLQELLPDEKLSKYINQAGRSLEDEVIDTTIYRLAPRQASKTKLLPRQRIAQKEADAQAVRDLDAYVRSTGEGIPTNGLEAASAAQRAAEKLFSAQDEAIKKMGGEVYRYPISNITGKLESLIKTHDITPKMRDSAKKLISQLNESVEDTGIDYLTPGNLVKQISEYNNELTKAFQQGGTGDSLTVLMGVRNELKNALLHGTGDEAGGAALNEIRRRGGQQLELSERLLRQAEKEAKGDSKTTFSIFDIAGIESLVHGHPEAAIANYVIGNIAKSAKSSGRALEKMFSAAEAANKKSGYEWAVPEIKITQAEPKTTIFDKTVGTEIPIKPTISGPKTRIGGNEYRGPYSREELINKYLNPDK